jgi:hypothetical protein
MIRNLLAGFTVAALMVAAILITDEDGWPHSPHNRIARLLVLIFVLVLIGLFVRWCPAVRPPGMGLGEPDNNPMSADDIATEYVAVIQNYEGDTINHFVEMLIDPPHYLDRIIEKAAIDPEAPRLRLSTHQLYRMRHSHQPAERGDKGLPETLLVPLLWPERGALMDQLEVSDASGRKIPTISYNQVRGLLAYTLEYHLTHLGPRLHKSRRRFSRDREYRKRAYELLGELIVVICAPGPLHKPAKADFKALETIMREISHALSVPESQMQPFKDFCKQYLNGYLIVVEVGSSSGCHLSLTYAHCVPIESPTNYPLNQWRERFGLNPSVIDIVHNPFAFEVEAYHLEISTQPDQYVFDHHLEWLDTRAHITQADLEAQPVRPYVRTYDEEGRPNAHLYIRRQMAHQAHVSSANGALSRTKSVVEFREIPPGALGGATIVACVSAIIISFFALTRLGFDQRASGGLAPLPALLLALPGFITVLLGSWIELSRLRRASLTTYLALFGTMLYSLTSALFYLFGSNRVLISAISLSPIFVDTWHIGREAILIRTDVGWLVLMVIAITHALFLFRQLMSELRYYHRCIRRRLENRLQPMGSTSLALEHSNGQ